MTCHRVWFLRCLLLVCVGWQTVAQDGAQGQRMTEEESPHAKTYNAMASVVTITALISLSIVFELGAEHLRQSTEDTNMPFINTIFSELTTLGFIGLVLFVISKSGYLSQMSVVLFGVHKPLELEETTEILHMALFLFIIIFLMLCLTLLKFGVQVQNEFREFERRAPYVQVVVADYCLASEPVTSWRERFNWRRAQEVAKRKREMVYVSLRRRFVDFRSNHPDPVRAHELAKDFQLERDTRFPFNEYLAIISGEVMARLIQIDATTWVALEVCLVSLLLVCWWVGPENEVFVFMAAGGFLVLLNQFVYNRIRRMRKLLTPPILFKKAERYRRNAEWRAQHKLPPLTAVKMDETIPLLPPEDSSLSDFIPPYIHDLPVGGVHLSIDQLKQAQKSLLGGGNGVLLALFSTRLVFLFTALHLSVFVLRTAGQLVERTDMGRTTKLACALLLVLPSCIVTSMSILIARDGLYAFNVEALKAPRVITKVMRLVKARQTLRTLRFIAEMKVYLREQDGYDANAEILPEPSPPAQETPRRSSAFGQTDTTKKKKPKRLLLQHLPSFHLDDCDDWDALSPRTRTNIEVPMSPLNEPTSSLWGDAQTSSQVKDQYEAETERREINAIFSLIDRDKSGKILVDEMEDFLQKVSPDMTKGHVARIMAELDQQQTGGVVFDDFEHWCRIHIHDQTAQQNKDHLIKEVFKMIDTDKSGYITVDEFISIFKSLGQSLDHDDVRDLVYQMDRNNDGKIDLTEFQKMLQKHAM
ncbi:unnamed protein product [Aphanomyces euteiches]